MATLEFTIENVGPVNSAAVAELQKLAGKHGLTVIVDPQAYLGPHFPIKLEGPDEEELESFKENLETSLMKVKKRLDEIKAALEPKESKGSLDELSDSEVKMIEEFQCSGCVRGSDVTCGAFKLWKESGVSCRGHIPGTAISNIGYILLGMPKGFNRIGDWYNYNDPMLMIKQVGQLGQLGEEAKGLTPAGGYDMTQTHIRLYTKETKKRPEWNKFNFAVWAMVENGYLFVRTYSPRINRTYIDVIEGGTLEMVPGAVNVGEFVKEID